MKDQNAVREDCRVRVAELGSMPASALRTLWQELIGALPAAGMRRELVIPILSYKLQEKTYGGLKPGTQAHLRRLAALISHREVRIP
jgi:Protein of unknown function (DUF2924)